MAFRDFDGEAAERARERDPIRFTLGGVEFEARPVIPFGASLDLAQAPELRDDMAGAVAGLVAFLEQVVIEEQKAEVYDAVRAADPASCYEMVRWLGEEYSGRPTTPSSGSAVSPLPDGRDSSSEQNDTASAA